MRRIVRAIVDGLLVMALFYFVAGVVGQGTAPTEPGVFVPLPQAWLEKVVLFMAKWGGVAACIVFLARIIVKLTPTPKDNVVLEYILHLLSHVGLKLESTDTGLQSGDNAGVAPGGVFKGQPPKP